MSKEEKIIFKVDFQTNNLDKKLKELNKEIVTLTESNKQLKKNGNETSTQFVKQKQKIKDLKSEYRGVSQAMSNAIKLRKTEKGSLEELKAKLSLVTAQINKMNKAERESTTEGKKLIAIRKQLNDELKKVEAKGGSFFRNVGNYTEGLKKLWAQFSVFFGITALIGMFKNALNTIKEFEQGSARLASVLGKTQSEITNLTDLARELGAVTQYTAKQVLELEEVLARLGFTGNEIENMTKSILNLATALDTSLAEAADLAGSTIRAFQYDTRDSGKVMDILSQSTRKSALSFEKLKVALPIVGAVAKNAGVSLEKLVAQLGVLSNRGLDASSSATALRKIYLSLAKSGMTLKDALSKIDASADKNKTSLELFGVRAAVAGSILSETTANVDELTTAMEKSDGVTDEMARVQMDTLQGALLRVKSAYDEFILSLSDKNGIGSKVKTFLNFIANNLKDILTTLVNFGSAYVALKAGILVFNLYKAAVNSATLSVNLFSKAMRSNLVGVIAGVVLLLWQYRQAIYDTIAGTTKLEKATKSVGEQFAKSAVEVEKLFYQLNSSNTKNEERVGLIRKINEQYGQYLPNLLTEKSSLEDINKAYKIINANLYNNAVEKERATKIEAIYQEKIRKTMDAVEGLTYAESQSIQSFIDARRAEGKSTEEAHNAYKKYIGIREGDIKWNWTKKQIQLLEGADKYNNSLSATEYHLKQINNTYDKLLKKVEEVNRPTTQTENNDNENTGGVGNSNEYQAQKNALKQAELALEQYRIKYHEELKNQTKLAKTESDNLIKIKEGELNKELNIIKEKYNLATDKLKTKYGKDYMIDENYKKEKSLLDQEYLVNKTNMTFTYEDAINKIGDDSLKYINELNQKKLEYNKIYFKQRLAQGKITVDEYNKEILQVELEYLKTTTKYAVANEKEKQLLIEQVKLKFAKKDNSALKLKYDKLYWSNKLALGEIKTAEYNKRMIEIEVAYLKKSKEYAILNEQQKQDAIQAIKLKYTTSTNKQTAEEEVKILGATKEQHKQKMQELYSSLLSLAQEYIDSLAQMKYDADQREIDAMMEQNDAILSQMDDRHDKELRALEYRYKSGEISEQQYLKNKLKLEDDYVDGSNSIKQKQAQEEKKLREQQLENQKKYQRASVMINAASAIISAWANTIPYPAGAIYAAAQSVVIGASAGIQLAQINSQHLAEGGILNGPLHAQGGIGGNTVEGGEYVINRASTQTYKPVLDYINNQGNGTNNTADMKPIIDYDVLANKLGSVINDKKVILTQDDLVEDENSRVMIDQNSTF